MIPQAKIQKREREAEISYQAQVFGSCRMAVCRYACLLKDEEYVVITQPPKSWLSIAIPSYWKLLHVQKMQQKKF